MLFLNRLQQAIQSDDDVTAGEMIDILHACPDKFKDVLGIGLEQAIKHRRWKVVPLILQEKAIDNKKLISVINKAICCVRISVSCDYDFVKVLIENIEYLDPMVADYFVLKVKYTLSYIADQPQARRVLLLLSKIDATPGYDINVEMKKYPAYTHDLARIILIRVVMNGNANNLLHFYHQYRAYIKHEHIFYIMLIMIENNNIEMLRFFAGKLLPNPATYIAPFFRFCANRNNTKAVKVILDELYMSIGPDENTLCEDAFIVLDASLQRKCMGMALAVASSLGSLEYIYSDYFKDVIFPLIRLDTILYLLNNRCLSPDNLIEMLIACLIKFEDFDLDLIHDKSLVYDVFNLLLNQDMPCAEKVIRQNAFLSSACIDNEPLIYRAIRLNHKTMVKRMLELGIEYPKSHQGYSILDYAVFCKRSDLIKLIMNHLKKNVAIPEDEWNSLVESEREGFNTLFRQWIHTLGHQRLYQSAQQALKRNCTLLTDSALHTVETTLARPNVLRFKKDKKSGVDYSVIKDESGKLFTIYSTDVKDQNLLSESCNGKAKFAYNHANQSFCVVKIIPFETYDDTEAEMLRKFGWLQGFQDDPVREKVYLFMDFIHGMQLREFFEFITSESIHLLEHHEASMILSFLIDYKNKFINIGYAHNDIHGGNVMIEPITMKVTIIDPGQCTSTKFARDKIDYYYNQEDLYEFINFFQTIGYNFSSTAVVNLLENLESVTTDDNIQDFVPKIDQIIESFKQIVDESVKNPSPAVLNPEIRIEEVDVERQMRKTKKSHLC